MMATLNVLAPRTATSSTASRSRRRLAVSASLDRQRRGAATAPPSPGKQYLMTLPGICPPLGFFDPLGLSSSPVFSVSEAKRFREAEVTHGRVAMLATVGWLVQERFHPLFGGNIGGPALRHFQRVQERWPNFWLVILLSIAIFEGVRIVEGWNSPRSAATEQIKDEYNPGEINFDPLNLMPKTAEARRQEGDADQGAEQRPAGHDRHRRLRGAGGGEQEQHLERGVRARRVLQPDRRLRSTDVLAGWWKSAIPGVTDRAADAIYDAVQAATPAVERAAGAASDAAGRIAEQLPNNPF